MHLSARLLDKVLHMPAKPYAAVLAATAAKYEINTPFRLAHWLGQMHIESRGFTVRKESLNYDLAGLLNTFSRKRITVEQARKVCRIPDRQKADQAAIADLVYGGDWGRKNLGNVQEGDGSRFLGRGFKQVTGRYNYTVMSTLMYGDDRLVGRPQLLEEIEPSAVSAGCFWDWKKLNRVADTNDCAAVTLIVNGGDNGLTERILATVDYLQRIENGMVSVPDFSNVVGGSDTVKGAG